MLVELRMGIADWVFVAVMTAALSGLVYMEIYRVIV